MYIIPYTSLFLVVLLLRRLACLKYLVLANMLMKSGINPFDSQEVGCANMYEHLHVHSVHVNMPTKLILWVHESLHFCASLPQVLEVS